MIQRFLSIKYNFKKAFTLIELLAVIGIIAVLASLVFPIIGKAKETGLKTKAASHLRQICLAYALCHQENPQSLKASTPQEWAEQLARLGGLNDAELYFVEGDAKLPPTLPKRVLESQGLHSPLNDAFAKAALSYCMVSNLPATASPATTPVIWTRGLLPDGTWASDSPYHGKGGHIGFLDGHVAWYTTLVGPGGEGVLSHYQTGAPTQDIKAAIPSRVWVLE